MKASAPKTYFDIHHDVLYLRHDTFYLPGFAKNHNLWSPNTKGYSMFPLLGECTDVDTLGKVENVALLLDNLWRYNTIDWIQRAEREKIRQTLLIFRDIKTLTLIVQHYKPGRRTYTPTLSYMEPVNVDTAFHELDRYQGHNGAYGDGPDLPQLNYLKVDGYSIEWIKQKIAPKEDHEVPRELPVIKYQICLPENVKARYESARTDCKARFHGKVAKAKYIKKKNYGTSFEEHLPVAGDRRYCLRSAKNGKSRRAGS